MTNYTFTIENFNHEKGFEIYNSIIDEFEKIGLSTEEAANKADIILGKVYDVFGIKMPPITEEEMMTMILSNMGYHWDEES